jgi:hypothetical protein
VDSHTTDNREFENARYAALVDLWCHHNTIQLQWPPVIVGAALLIISSIMPGKVSKISNHSYWGNDLELILVVGIPMLLTGLGLLILIYIMKRARTIMIDLEQQISTIDELRGVERGFYLINHPPGLSGARLISHYLLICFALPITTFGILLSVGLRLGIWCLALVILVLLFGPALRGSRILLGQMNRRTK